MTIRSWVLVVAAVAAAGSVRAAAAERPLIHKVSESLPGADPSSGFRCVEDDHGGFYLAWVDVGEPRSILLRAQHYGSEGRPQWEESGPTVSSALFSVDDWHAIADGTGGLTLIWVEADGIRTQRFRPDGSRRLPGSSLLLSTYTVSQPDAVPDAIGGTLVVWSEMLPAGRPVLRVQRLDNEGRAVWPAGGVRVSLRASQQTNPRVIYDNMSGLIVAWRDEVNSASELRVQRMDFGGNSLWGLEGLKIMAPMGKAEYPRLAPLKPGEVVLAWTEAVTQKNQIVLQAAGPQAGLKWNPPAHATRGKMLFNQWNPILRGDEEGGTWIVWEDYRNQMNYLLQLNHLDGAGLSRWSRGEITVAAGSGDQGKAAMITDEQDGVWLAWIDNRNATIGLYAQEVNEQGNLFLGRTGFLVADDLRKASTPHLASLGPGKAVVCWAESPIKGRRSLRWAFLASSPQTVIPAKAGIHH